MRNAHSITEFDSVYVRSLNIGGKGLSHCYLVTPCLYSFILPSSHRALNEQGGHVKIDDDLP